MLYVLAEIECKCSLKHIFEREMSYVIKAKLYVEPPWVGGTKVCSRHLGHVTKILTLAQCHLHIKIKNLLFSETTGLFLTKFYL